MAVTRLLRGTWAIEVPHDVVDVQIIDKEGLPRALLVYLKDDWFNPGRPVPVWPIPDGELEYLFCTEYLTEEKAKKVVEPHGDGFLDYEEVFTDNAIPMQYAFISPIQSFRSLLRSKGLDPINYNYAILKQFK